MCVSVGLVVLGSVSLTAGATLPRASCDRNHTCEKDDHHAESSSLLQVPHTLKSSKVRVTSRHDSSKCRTFNFNSGVQSWAWVLDEDCCSWTVNGFVQADCADGYKRVLLQDKDGTTSSSAQPDGVCYECHPHEDNSTSCTPESDCWPRASDWDVLNSTLNGTVFKLSPGIQLSHYNYYAQPSSLLAMPAYVVEAETVEHVVKALEFARSFDVAVSVKNNGHSYIGSSAGLGTLLIWVGPLEQVALEEGSYQDSCGTSYPNALKVGGGATWGRVYETIGPNYSTVGGTCGTVSASGGWLGGTGLSSQVMRMHGLGVDNVLDYDLVIANGSQIRVDACSHPLLFRALRGGGGGTFGVVTAVHYRLLPPYQVHTFRFIAIRLLSYQLWEAVAKHAVTLDKRWSITSFACVRLYEALIDPTSPPPCSAYEDHWGSSMMEVIAVEASYIGNKADAVESSFYHDMYAASLLKPRHMISLLKAEEHSFNRFDEYKRANPIGPSDLVRAGGRHNRLIPRELFVDYPEDAASLLKSIERALANTDTYHLGGRVFEEGELAPNATSVNPLFRSAIFQVGIADDAVNRKLRERFPATGINHAGWDEPEWQISYWGSDNYKFLQEIKTVYDPSNLFRCRRCVEPAS